MFVAFNPTSYSVNVARACGQELETMIQLQLNQREIDLPQNFVREIADFVAKSTHSYAAHVSAMIDEYNEDDLRMFVGMITNQLNLNGMNATEDRFLQFIQRIVPEANADTVFEFFY